MLGLQTQAGARRVTRPAFACDATQVAADVELTPAFGGAHFIMRRPDAGSTTSATVRSEPSQPSTAKQ